MPADDRDGAVGVPVAQRFQDLAVLGEGGGGAVGVRLEHGDPHPQLPVAQLVVEAGEDLVPGAADDLRVEAAVADGGSGQITGRHLGGLLGQQLGQPLDELGSGGHGLARGELLDQQPGLHHVVDLLRGDGEDQGALLRVQLDEPLDLQFEQRLPHGRPGDPHGIGELALGEERPALVATVEYGLLDVRVDAVGGGGLFQRGDWHEHSIDTTGIRWGERPHGGMRMRGRRVTGGATDGAADGGRVRGGWATGGPAGGGRHSAGGRLPESLSTAAARAGRITWYLVMHGTR